MSIPENIPSPSQAGEGPWTVSENGVLNCNGIEHQITQLRSPRSRMKVEDIRAIAAALNQSQRDVKADKIQLSIQNNDFEISPYEKIVDDFLAKLPDLGFHGDISKLKTSIIKNGHLDLSFTPLRSLPPEIGNLRNLEKLRLDATQLTSLPPEIGNLSNLQMLSIACTQLTSLPPEIGNLSNLQRFHLYGTQLTSVPSSFRNLTNLVLLDLQHTPIAAQGGENTWGRQELRAFFGDVVSFRTQTGTAMPTNTTIEEVYRELDKQPVRIDREQLKNTKMAEIPGSAIEDGEDFLLEFHKVLSKLNFEKEREPGYISHALLAGDFASRASEGENWEMIRQNVLKRLSGYFKTLYELPLEPGERGGWQMYEDKKPALKKALSYILTQMVALEDPEQLALLFTQLVDGLLHCPTGQKEGIDTVCLALLERKAARSSDLPTIVYNAFAIKKNAIFKTAILTKGAENSQNVHLISTYEGKLKVELGLSNVLQYDERLGTMGFDPFNNNPANVLKVFYELVTPARMVDWMVEKTQSTQDAELRKRLAELQKRQLESTPQTAPLIAAKEKLEKELDQPESDKPTLTARIDQLTRMIRAQKVAQPLSPEEQREIAQLKAQLRAIHLFKPISMHIILDYLSSTHKIFTELPDWWKEYFTLDPETDETASLTRPAALKLLGHLGYISSSPSGR